MAATETRAAILTRLARDINCLSDADKFKRKRAIQTVTAALFESAEAPSFEIAREIVCHDLVRQLAALVSDGSEMNRELALALLLQVMQTEQAAGNHQAHVAIYPTMITVLIARVGKVPFAEEAEEIRFKLATLLNSLLASAGTHHLTLTHSSDIADILRSLASDAFPQVKIASSEGVELFCKAAPGAIHKYLQSLVLSQAANFSHQRGPVRLAALQALHACLPLGGESLEKVLGDVAFPACRNMRFDRTSSLRRHLAVVCADLLATLPQHVLNTIVEGQLLYIICGLIADEAAEVRSQGLSSLCDAASRKARAAQVAHTTASSTFITAMSADMVVAAEAASIDDLSAMSMAGGGMTLEEDGMPKVSDVPSHTPDIHPFNEHLLPAGLVEFAQQRLKSVMPLIVEDLRDWTAKTRVFAAGALRSLFPLAQSAMTAHLNEIIGLLCSGSRDDDADVRRLLGDSGNLLGLYVPAEAQLGVLLPQLNGTISGMNNSQHYAAALAVLAAAVSSMETTSLLPHLPALVQTLRGSQLADDDPPVLRKQLALALRALISQALPENCALLDDPKENALSPATVIERTTATITASLHGKFAVPLDILLSLQVVLLHVLDPLADDDTRDIAAHCIDLLVQKFCLSSIHDLFAYSVVHLLKEFTADCSSWDRHARNRKNFDSLIRNFRPALAGRSETDGVNVMAMCASVFAVTLSPSKDPDLRVVMLALLDALIVNVHEVPTDSPPSATQPIELHRMDILPAKAESSSSVQLGDSDNTYRAGHSTVDAHVLSISAELVAHSLLPNIVWRAGMVASTIRKVALSCILSLFRRRLIDADGAAAVLVDAVPILLGALSDDDAGTREVAVSIFGNALMILGGAVSEDQCYKLYPEFLKRLDDSNDSVRTAACATLRTLGEVADACHLRGTSAKYTIDTLLVHLDDMNPQVQHAVADCLEKWIVIEPAHAVAVLRDALPKHRNPALCQHLLNAAEVAMADIR